MVSQLDIPNEAVDPNKQDRAQRDRRVPKMFSIGYAPMQSDQDTPKENYENKDEVGGGYNRWTGF